jgi:anti-sigma B factor antagonist
VSVPAVIAPTGEIDVARIDEFRAALAEAFDRGGRELIVDLTGVSFIDSTGLGAIVDYHYRLRRDERRLALVAPGGTAAALLINLAGLRGRMTVYESVQAAIAQL